MRLLAAVLALLALVVWVWFRVAEQEPAPRPLPEPVAEPVPVEEPLTSVTPSMAPPETRGPGEGDPIREPSEEPADAGAPRSVFQIQPTVPDDVAAVATELGRTENWVQDQINRSLLTPTAAELQLARTAVTAEQLQRLWDMEARVLHEIRKVRDAAPADPDARRAYYRDTFEPARAERTSAFAETLRGMDLPTALIDGFATRVEEEL